MKYLLAFALSLQASALLAQVHKKTIVKNQPQKPVEYALIRGHIKNNNMELLDYGTNDFLDYNVSSLPVDKEGNFSRKIKITGVVREVALDVGSGILLKLMPNDTVDLAWDNNNVNASLTIKTNKAIRTAEFQKAFKIRLLSIENHQAINDLYSSKLSDSAKFIAINDRFNKEIEALMADDPYHLAAQMSIDTYFEYMRTLQLWNLFPHYEVYLRTEEAKKQMSWMITGFWTKPYKTESYDYFMSSASYRDFIFDYARAIAFSATIGKTNSTKADYAGLNPPLSDYYKGLGSFNLIALRDWFVTKSILTDFQYYDFEDASEVYKDFMTKVKTPLYADTLKTFYANIKRLKPGSPAPVFKLKDEAGKFVSLSDFKGKVVYIDFWGVGCGPCVAAIKENVPGLHEKYKGKDIVFVNICVDSDEQTWKESIKKLKLNGVNLLAQGWTQNPVCNAYNVEMIPHYYLINKSGAIANNNSKSPGFGVETDIDNLLK